MSSSGPYDAAKDFNGRPPPAPPRTDVDDRPPGTPRSSPPSVSRVRTLSNLSDSPGRRDRMGTRRVKGIQQPENDLAAEARKYIEAVANGESVQEPLHPLVPQTLKVSDIVAGRKESEAETTILKGIEKQELEDAGGLDGLEPIGAHILPNIPSESSFKAPPPAYSQEEEKKEGSPKSKWGKVKASVNRGDLAEASAGSKTLDVTLFDLAQAMRQVHSKDESDAFGEDVLPGAVFVQEIPQTTEDMLVHNANLLFRGNAKKEEIAKEPTMRSPKRKDSMWSLGEGAAKKTDEEQEDYVSGVVTDVETGAMEGDGRDSVENSGRRSSRMTKSRVAMKGMKNLARGEFESYTNFFKPRQQSTWLYCKTVVLYVIIPVTGIAALLFYAAGNPLMQAGTTKVTDPATGITVEIDNPKGNTAISWFLLFLGVRHVICFSFAAVAQVIVIDFIALKTRFFITILGPMLTLMIVQSKGWPFIFSWWGFFAFLLLSGSSEFANHWCYYQDAIELFNASNPSGNIISSEWNFRCLLVAVFVGFVVCIKRFLLGLYLGKRTYKNYGSDTAKLIHDMVIVSRVAELGAMLESLAVTNEPIHVKPYGLYARCDWEWRGFDGTELEEKGGTENEKAIGSAGSITSAVNKAAQDEGSSQDAPTITNAHALYSSTLHSSAKIRMMDLLDAWEEPEGNEAETSSVSVNCVIRFREALACMDMSYPFSQCFGLANTRANCVQSSEVLYNRLLLAEPDNSDSLSFETLAVLTKDEDGELDSAKTKDLIRLFRPSREGKLTVIEFVTSIDSVYKTLKMLRASIRSSSQIDHAFEVIINWVFYFFLGCIVLFICQIDPFALFLSLSGILISFTFIFGGASARYFDGILHILARRPYDIGNRIAVSAPDQDTSGDGSSTWFVEQVDLFTTTVRFATTNEVASIANSALAPLRVINAARSPKAVVYLRLKFAVKVPYSKVKLFRKTVEKFVKARPREWLSLSGFRASRVEADLGFIEYTIAMQHRESWQNMGPILQSKADLFSFCLEIQKQLGMSYSAPPVPVDLSLMRDQQQQLPSGDNEPAAPGHRSTPSGDIAALFGSPTSSRKSSS